MTSRVEAVAKRLRERADDVFSWRDNDHGIDDQTWLQLAQAAIETNDAWLKKRGWKEVPITPTPHMKDEGWDYFKDAETCWELMIEASPLSAEEPDQ